MQIFAEEILEAELKGDSMAIVISVASFSEITSDTSEFEGREGEVGVAAVCSA